VIDPSGPQEWYDTAGFNASGDPDDRVILRCNCIPESLRVCTAPNRPHQASATPDAPVWPDPGG
jgi:hypothetical protein